MPRAFRVAADEQRYNAIKTELYLRLANSASPLAVSEILRNLAKLEELAFYEGVRQGMAASWLAEHDDELALKTHFDIYGMAATPLTRVEEALCQEMSELVAFDLTHPWLDAAPIQFAPMTLAEANAEGLLAMAVAPAPTAPLPTRAKPPEPVAARDEPDISGIDLDDLAESIGASREQLDELLREPAADDPPAEPPDLLDRIRDHILGLSDWKPENWEEMILKLHRELAMDAGYLDLILSSPMGLTVLSQCGFTHLHPGASVMMSEDGKLTVR